MNALLRPALGAIALLVVLSTPGARARAQEDEDSIPVDDPAPASDSGADEATDSPAPTPEKGAKGAKGVPKGEPPQVSETHVVQSGDTLWDLCSKYLNSPWYWPKIWSYNPQITNPHWIFPGNELRFYPSDENLPTNVEVSQQMTIPQNNSDDTAVPDTVENEDLVRTAGNQAIGHAIPNSYFSTHIGYVSPSDHDRAGEIVNAESEAYMLSDFDKTYIKLKAPAKKGENYAVYRVIRPIEHPLTGDPYGYLVEILGGVTIVDTSPSVATGQVSESFGPLERGDFVGKWPEGFGHRIVPAPNASEAHGYIIESAGDLATQMGEHDIVFIDKGRRDGIQQGNTFSVVARGDPYTAETAGLPNEDIGAVMIIAVEEKASTAVVTRAVRELAIGDKVEMRRQ